MVVEEGVAGGEEFVGGFDAADGVLEVGGVALDDVDEVAFHLLDVFGFDEVSVLAGGLLIEEGDVFEDHASGDLGNFLTEEGGAELGEEPGVADGAASDHEAGGVCFLKVG